MPRAKRARDESGGDAPAAKTQKSKHGNTNDQSTSHASTNKGKNVGKEKAKDDCEPDPHEFITMCRPFNDLEAENYSEPKDEQLDRDELMQQNKCGTDGCMCGKPVSEHPDWKWMITHEGMKRVNKNRLHSDYRCPDLFGMYVYNDFHGYGIVEMVENLLLAFSKAKTIMERWVVIETIAHFLTGQESMTFNHIDDGYRVSHMIEVIGCAFLTMLDQLEREDFLNPNSKIKDLPLIMALFLQVSDQYVDARSLSDPELPWDEHVVTYANKNGIRIAGPFGIESTVGDKGTSTELPKRKGRSADRWGWKKKLAVLENEYGKFGGEHFDITKWSRQERAKHAFDKKDPLSDEVVKALKEGADIELA